MPLYMDLHHIDPDLTQEDLDAAHIKDLLVEEKYRLKHKKYYVNFEERTVFCLIKAPDKEALHHAHAEVHGVGPCNIIEVTSLTPTFDFYSMIGEEGGKNAHDVALTRNGEIDTGCRTLLRVSINCLFGEPDKIEKDILDLINKHEGPWLNYPMI